MDLPYVAWLETIEALSREEQSALESAAMDVAERSAFLAAYLAARLHRASDHDKAVKAANRRRTVIRRALGYSYPKLGQVRF